MGGRCHCNVFFVKFERGVLDPTYCPRAESWLSLVPRAPGSLRPLAQPRGRKRVGSARARLPPGHAACRRRGAPADRHPRTRLALVSAGDAPPSDLRGGGPGGRKRTRYRVPGQFGELVRAPLRPSLSKAPPLPLLSQDRDLFARMRSVLQTLTWVKSTWAPLKGAPVSHRSVGLPTRPLSLNFPRGSPPPAPVFWVSDPRGAHRVAWKRLPLRASQMRS